MFEWKRPSYSKADSDCCFTAQVNIVEELTSKRIRQLDGLHPRRSNQDLKGSQRKVYCKLDQVSLLQHSLLLMSHWTALTWNFSLVHKDFVVIVIGRESGAETNSNIFSRGLQDFYCKNMYSMRLDWCCSTQSQLSHKVLSFDDTFAFKEGPCSRRAPR